MTLLAERVCQLEYVGQVVQSGVVAERVVAGAKVEDPHLSGVITSLELGSTGMWTGRWGHIDFQHIIVFDRLQIKGVYVPEGFRRRGVGSSLVRGIESIAEQRRVSAIRGEVLPGQHDIIPFWQSLGYTFVEAERGRCDFVSKQLRPEITY